jgi:hypothetical protein
VFHKDPCLSLRSLITSGDNPLVPTQQTEQDLCVTNLRWLNNQNQDLCKHQESVSCGSNADFQATPLVHTLDCNATYDDPFILCLVQTLRALIAPTEQTYWAFKCIY